MNVDAITYIEPSGPNVGDGWVLSKSSWAGASNPPVLPYLLYLIAMFNGHGPFTDTHFLLLHLKSTVQILRPLSNSNKP